MHRKDKQTAAFTSTTEPALERNQEHGLPKSQNIEGLIFDLGGVVIDIDFNQALKTWEEWSALPIEEIQRRFKMDATYERHERGEIEASEYFAHIRKILELEATDTDIASGWNAIFVGEIFETVSNILSVRDQLPCFAFTNSNTTHQIVWMSAYPRVVESFHRIFVSSELGFRKPEREAFNAIAEATGISLDALLFFDDTEENVLAAQVAGLKTVYVKAPADVRQALLEIDVL